MKKHKKHCLKGKKGNDIALKWTKGDPPKLADRWKERGYDRHFCSKFGGQMERERERLHFVVNSARPYPHADKESAENTFAPRGAYANI